jgi:hypothetical protein
VLGACALTANLLRAASADEWIRPGRQRSTSSLRLATSSPAARRPRFRRIVVGLDAFGIVTQVTIDIEPDFAMRQDAYEGLAWAVLLDDFDAVMAAGYSVSLMTMWSGPAVTRQWIKTRLADGVPETVSAAHLGAVPAARPSAVAALEVMLRFNPFGLPGPWSKRLPHFRTDVIPGPAGHLQSEYILPRARRRRRSHSCVRSATGSTGMRAPRCFCPPIRCCRRFTSSPAPMIRAANSATNFSTGMSSAEALPLAARGRARAPRCACYAS